MKNLNSKLKNWEVKPKWGLETRKSGLQKTNSELEGGDQQRDSKQTNIKEKN